MDNKFLHTQKLQRNYKHVSCVRYLFHFVLMAVLQLPSYKIQLHSSKSTSGHIFCKKVFWFSVKMLCNLIYVVKHEEGGREFNLGMK